MATTTGKPSPPPTPPPNPNSNPFPNLPIHPVKSSRIEASNKSSTYLSPSPSFSRRPLFPMGHGASKQERGMKQRPVMKLIQLKIEEVKRRVRMRKSSIVSRAELLRMVDDDSAPSTVAKDKKEKEKQGAGSPETIANADAASGEKVNEEKRIDEEENVATEAAEEEKRDLGFRGAEEAADEKGRKLGCLTAFADLPESPSFRFYCTDLARDSDDDNSVKFGGGRRNDQLPDMKEKGRKVAHESDDGTGSEDLEVKPLKKEKGRKLKALTKAPSRVYDLLNVRNCYCHHSSTTIL